VLRSLLGASLLVGCVLLAHEAGAGEAKRPTPEFRSLVPDTTAGFLSITNYKHFSAQWDKTQLGHLMADEVMAKFKEDLKKQLQDRWAKTKDRLGLTLDDLKGLPNGEVAFAIIRPGPGQSALAILADVSGNEEEARKVLQKSATNLVKQGAKKKEDTYKGVKIQTFDIPKKDNVAPAAEAPKTGGGTTPKGKAAAKPEAAKIEFDHAAYFLSGSLLVAADNVAEIKKIIDRVQGAPGKSLAESNGFVSVMNRCQQDAGAAAVPQLRWFVVPVAYAEASRAAMPEDDRRKGKTIHELLQNQGFAAIQGIGGFFDFAPEDGLEMRHRTAIFAPPPYEKAMKMLSFPNGQDFTPQPWVPRKIATYTTLNIDVVNAFDNFGPLFDELFGESNWLFNCDIKFAKDLNAERLTDDFRKEFSAKTNARILLSKNAKVTVKVPSKHWLIKDRIKIKDDDPEKAAKPPVEKDVTFIIKVAKKPQKGKPPLPVLRVAQEISGLWDEVKEGLKIQPNGPQIDLKPELIKHLGPRITVLTNYELPVGPKCERLLFAVEAKDEKAVAAAIAKLMKSKPPPKRIEEGGRVIWQVAEPEPTDEFAPPVVAIPQIKVGEVAVGSEKESKQSRLLPHLAVTVSDGHLFIASHIDFLRKLFDKDEPKGLDKAVDFQMVVEEVKKMNVQGQCAFIFSRTDEEYFPTYELIRQGRMPEAETMLGRLINTIASEDDASQMREQKIDGTNLPEFNAVRRYLGPAGLVVGSEKEGWIVRGFTLTK